MKYICKLFRSGNSTAVTVPAVLVKSQALNDGDIVEVRAVGAKAISIRRLDQRIKNGPKAKAKGGTVNA